MTVLLFIGLITSIFIFISIVAGPSLGMFAGILMAAITTPLLLTDKQDCSEIRPIVVYAQDSSSKILKYAYKYDSEILHKTILLNRDSKDFYIPDSLYLINSCSEQITVKTN
jgi:hypothetical protein